MTTTWTEQGRPLSTYEGIEYPVAAHIHDQVDIVNLITGLDSKAPKLNPILKSASTTVDSVVIDKIAGQTSSLLRIRDDVGATLVRVDSSGALRALYGAQIIPLASDTVGLIVQGNASQTGRLQQWRNSAGTNMVEVQSDGFFGAYSGASILPFSASNVGLRVVGRASQTANLVEHQLSDGTLRSGITSSGFGFFGGPHVGAHLSVSAPLPGERPLLVRGAASQTANLQEWQDSAGAVLALVKPNGQVRGTTLIGGRDLGAPISFAATLAAVAPGDIPLLIRGTASQTGNLQEWQNSAGAIVARIMPDGQMELNLFAGPGNLYRVIQLGAADSAGAGFRTVRVAN